jgi:hypothetical protein
MPIQVIGMLVTLYFFARLFMTAILMLLGGPTSTRKIAWYTPFGAHVQCGIANVAAIAMVVVRPEVHIENMDITLERSWGGPLLVGVTLLAQVAIYWIAQDRDLAVTQTWITDESDPEYVPKKKSRWVRLQQRERPLVKPPLSPAASVDANAYRAAPPTGLAAQLVTPETKTAVPRADNTDAPQPKLLT